MNRMIIIVGGIVIFVVLIIVLAGMYKFNYLANQPGYDVDGNKTPITGVDTSALIGMTIEQGQEFAKQNDTFFRVIKKDGQHLPATMDYRPGRINAETENGVITGFTIE